MITLPPPYHIIQTTLDMDMNARQRRITKRLNARLTKEREQPSENDALAQEAERIEADPELTNNKTCGWILAGLFISLICGAIAAWSYNS